jgi:hypothetical protein
MYAPTYAFALLDVTPLPAALSHCDPLFSNAESYLQVLLPLQQAICVFNVQP